MRLPLLSPSELVTLVGSVRDAVTAALELVPRITMLVDRIERLLARVETVVAQVEATTAAADDVVDRSAATQRRADRAAAGAQGVVNRIDPLLSGFEPSLRTLMPTLATLAKTTSEHEVAAGVSLIDRLPTLITHVDDDVLPLLMRLDQVGPDLHELLEVTQDLRRVITGLPGVGLLRRRGDDELPSEHEDR